MCCDEINETIICKDSEAEYSSAFQIRGNSNFHWGVNANEHNAILDQRHSETRKIEQSTR